MKPKQCMYCALFTGFNICGTPESEAINLQKFCQILGTQTIHVVQRPPLLVLKCKIDENGKCMQNNSTIKWWYVPEVVHTTKVL